MDFSLELTNDSFYPPNHKTHFSFALWCPQDFNFALQFWCGRVETGLNRWKWMEKLKFCMHPRTKLKHVLWLGDLKASLTDCAAITRHLMNIFVRLNWRLTKIGSEASSRHCWKGNRLVTKITPFDIFASIGHVVLQRDLT